MQKPGRKEDVEDVSAVAQAFIKTPELRQVLPLTNLFQEIIEMAPGSYMKHARQPSAETD
jgi:hypothetical protein